MKLIRNGMTAAALLAAACWLAGCGSSEPGADKVTGSVVITVTADGAPVTQGSVNLANPATGEGGGGSLDETGTVTIDRVAVGEYTVTILPPEADPVPPAPGQAPPPNPDDGTIPARYRSTDTSPLKAKVEEGENSFSFALEE
ncbi:MAG: carboxypeptidase regulatory-like domain-containing protein [Planctomycetaceae bacterium]|nr:carboxypeptidase regulatory-like domain-containing protein [Planctomycetaceae bacterium]